MMKRFRIIALVCATCLVATCLVAGTACSSKWKSTANTGLVAATVNGVEISEDDVTKIIENFRDSYGYDTQDQWKEYLEMYGETPETLRTDVLDSLIDAELMRQGAAKMGITVSEEEVNEAVATIKGNYSTDEAWEEALANLNMDEAKYRQNITDSLLQERVIDKLLPSKDAPEEKVLELCTTYAKSYDGMHRGSHILFSADDEATAQKVLDDLKAGKISFEDAAKEHSLDGSGADGGDVGWDSLNSFVEEFDTALGELGKGEISGLVTSTYGIHIIKCTDVFEAPEKVTRAGQVPDELYDRAKSSADSTYQSDTYNDWLEEQRDAADIKINDMPEGMSYYVKIEKEEPEEDDEEGAEGDDHDHDHEGEGESDE